MMRYLWFVAWAIGVSVPLCYAIGIHYAVLPGGNVSPRETHIKNNQIAVTHFIAAGCPCSKLVIDRLASRGRLAAVDERVWMIGDDADSTRSLVEKGFTVERVMPDTAFKTFGVTGGPWLVIQNRDGAVVYSGGYAERRPTTTSQLCDVELIRRASNGETLKAFPAYGCATSSFVKRAIDPLGLKYE